MIDPYLELPPLKPSLVQRLSQNPDGILEQIAEEYGASTFDVVHALPQQNRAIVPGSAFERIMTDLTHWGEVLFVVHTPGIVLECKGSIPPGSTGRGYFNVHGNSPIGGHIRADRCHLIAFVSRPFMGRHSCSIQFFDEAGDAIFKVFVQRDENRDLLIEQVRKFEKLRETMRE